MADEENKTDTKAEVANVDDVCSDDTVAEKSETLKKYEEMFANRFTAEDEEFQRYVNRPADPPPIVEDWGGRAGGDHRGRDNRHHDRGGYRGRGWGGDRGWRGDHRDRHWHDRDRNRDRDRDRYGGHGSGYHSGPPNSYNQRPQYDRY